MSKLFNGSPVELLAPAGTFEIFKAVIAANCDAVYLGGKKLNMRMHRIAFNLTDTELTEAVSMAHSLGKKIYVTVNNLHSQSDLEDVTEYLRFLERIQPDALIIQDFSILSIIRDSGMNLELHSSVMMDVHNLETVKTLKTQGIRRIVISRETPLYEVKLFRQETGMEFEYFVHGDMCAAHGGQCVYSGMLYGQSSNRGRCLKPCRWDYKMMLDGKLYGTEFPIAARDMYMYENIPELIENGVTSFKIEGRMRDAAYITDIVNTYGDAIDRYIADPVAFDRKHDTERLYESRKRDFSTFYAFGSNDEIINRRLEGTGAFYSTGKMFSTATAERELTVETTESLKGILASSHKENTAQKAQFGVKVNSYNCAATCIDEGIDNIYLSGDVYLPDKPFRVDEIRELAKNKGSSKVFLALPRVMKALQFDEYSHLLTKYDLGIDGLLVTNLGAVSHFKKFGLPLIGDHSLNIYNHIAADYYAAQGLSAFTMSLEMPLAEVIQTAQKCSVELELVVHGSPEVMIFEYDLYVRACGGDSQSPATDQHSKYTDDSVLVLVDDAGNEHPVYKDSRGVCHMLTCKELCHIGLLDGLMSAGISRFRIEGCHYNEDELRQVIRAYKYGETLKPLRQGFTSGAFEF